MFCPSCGKEISDNSMYCNRCGMKINKDEVNLVKCKDDFAFSERITEAEIPNSKKLKAKKIIISLIILIIMCGSGFGVYKYVQAKDFNDLIKNANQKLNAGNYDEAIQLYNKALMYKNDSNVEKELATAQNYKRYQDIYNEGLKLFSDKKYSDAMQKFSTINQSALPIYNNAQKKVAECKKQIISEDIQSANDLAKNNKYDEANKYLDDILKIDNNNSDAKNLKDTFAKAVKEQQDKAKTEEQVQQASSKAEQKSPTQNNNSNNNSQYTEYAMQVRSIEEQVMQINYELTTLSNTSDAYINKLDEKEKLLYQEKAIVEKMESISGNQ